MSNEELVQRIKAGERDLMADLWTQNRGLLWRFVARYRFIGEPEDLMQCAFLGLLRAVEGYDESAGVKFMTYAQYPIRTTVRRELGLDSPPRLEADALSLDAPIGEEGDSTLTDFVADPSPTPDVLADLDDLRAQTRAAVDRLPQRQGNIIRRRWFEGQTLKDAAAADGTSAQYAAQLERAGMRRLRTDWRLLKLLDEYTNYYKPGGLRKFRRTWGSSVEEIVLWRAELAERYGTAGT